MAKKALVKPSRDTVIADVLDGMHEGLSLRQSCLAAGTNTPTFLRWVAEDEKLAEQYAHAREALIDRLADDLLIIADAPVGSTDTGATDSGAVQKQRLQVDTRKWLLSKVASKKYGDKVQTTITGADGGPVESYAMTHEERERRIAELAAKAGYTG